MSSTWKQTYEASEWSLEAISAKFGPTVRQLKGWLYNGVQPQKTNLEIMEKIMARIGKDTKKIPYHPSYGYATPEQIEKLNSLKLGDERNYLLARIAKQNESGGKTRF